MLFYNTTPQERTKMINPLKLFGISAFLFELNFLDFYLSL